MVRAMPLTTPLDVQSLVAAIEAGREFSFRFFWGNRPRNDGKLSNACFSQWWASAFTIQGNTYTTAEQWMMSSKARLFGDHEGASQMMQVADPGKIKALGRDVKGFEQDTWDSACFDVVTIGNIAKFGQDPRLRKYLLKSGDDVLAEASPTDVVWGIGFTRDAPEATNPKAWRGLNLLGFALMRARGVLRGELRAPAMPGT